jgi:glucose/arabinose dehydrogenase
MNRIGALALGLIAAAGLTPLPVARAATLAKPPDQELNRNVTLSGNYSIHMAVSGLNFPTGLTFGDGVMYVSESGIAGSPRIVRVGENGSIIEVAGGFNTPVTGVTFHDGWLYVAHKGVITRLHPDGSGRQDIITGLPSNGDHSNEQITFGADGMMYFTIGTATNSGVVGPDNSPAFVPEVPCEDIQVHGANFTSPDPRTPDTTDTVTTGPYLPFGTPASEGQLIPGNALCNGAILRANPDGTGIQVYAWGFRNPFGLRFDASGQLWATNNGMDERGSRPVEGDVDMMFKVVQGGWYGWPDFAHGIPVNEVDEENGDIPLLLARHPQLSPEASGFAFFDDHVSTDGFDFSSSDQFRFVGDAFVAETGSIPPFTGAEGFFGYRVTRVDMETGKVTVFLANKSGVPAFVSGKPGINKPIDVKFDPDHPEQMFVLDFGAFLPPDTVQPNSGVVWLVVRGHDLPGDQAGNNGKDHGPNARITRVDPNPSARAVRVSFSLSQGSPATVRIYDISGRLVRTLVDRQLEAGDHQAVWDGRDESGKAVGRGIYLARLAAREERDQRKILIQAK